MDSAFSYTPIILTLEVPYEPFHAPEYNHP
jgi:hypothetical protein